MAEKKAKSARRKARLERALRANIARRKAQARSREAAGASGSETPGQQTALEPSARPDEDHCRN
ncbi:hypothetical protein [Aestuariivirga sp.]|jgi:hypothetical protein|uniref:hypothetical protein n=1 Tax=Aestuariivirga sp. TaxID=2650926 RepID=UPI0037836ACB